MLSSRLRRKRELLLMEAVEPRLLLTVNNAFNTTYFNNADLTSPVTTADAQSINFNWAKNSPAPGVDPNTFSVQWTGFIQPTYTQAYTFYTTADDGVRLSINGQ